MELSEKMVRDLKKKFEVEMNKKEIEIIDHWKKELEAIYRKKHESMGALQVDLKNLMERMANRESMLARMVKEGV